jgi:CheY-like chemotaxis protein
LPGPTIFFVEDNPETKFVLEASLRTSPYNLEFSFNLPEARAMIKTLVPDVIVLDRFIDEVDTMFFIAELKAGGYQGPILVISVINEPQAALAAGANAFLAKPITPFKLTSTLRGLLDGQEFNTILLADDDEVSRYLLGDALSHLGYNIIEAHNGREALRMIEIHNLNGIFLDVVMPDLTGFEVLREVRRNSLKSGIPVILHSSKEFSSRETIEIASLGAFSFPKRDFSAGAGLDSLREMLAAAGMGH